MTEAHTHHDTAAANAKHFSERAHSYRSELTIELAKRSAGVILEKYSFDANKSEALDFACGPGLIALELLPHVKCIIGADSAQGMVDIFNQSVEHQGISSEKCRCVYIERLQGDQTDLDGALFDVVICVQAYHHFDDPKQMTRALAQRLKPNGRLIVIDFVGDEGITSVFAHSHEHIHSDVIAHKHGFSLEQMFEIFKSSGLDNIQVENAFKMSKSEMKSFQGHEIFGQVMQNNEVDFTLTCLVAYGDKISKDEH